ncbi:MAG: LysR family transcriptional regulator [Burkholderiales bacterium]|nr:LysR family transcriptional regulator [Burkholderiales bacterium]
MELYQIRYFLAVAETQNFTRASERAYVSQPALTKAIQRLEETLGGRLFDRAKNPVQLTELGQAMLPNMRQIYDGALRAREEARRIVKNKRETVRVGVMCTIDFQHVLPAFAQAQEAGDDHRFTGRQAVALAELDREHYCERTFCEFSNYIERLLDKQGVRLQVVQQSQREDWIQAFVRANFGIAFMPRSIALAAGLSHVFTADCPIVREVNLLVPSERALTPAQQAVIAALSAFDWQTAPANVAV